MTALPGAQRAPLGRRAIVLGLLLAPLVLCGWQTLRWVAWDGTARSQAGLSGAYCPPNFESRSALPEGTPCSDATLHRFLEPLPWLAAGILYVLLLAMAWRLARRARRRADVSAPGVD